jgi:hypothetical protein
MPMRVDENSDSQASGNTQAQKSSIRRQPRSMAAARMNVARNPKTYGRSVKVPNRRSMLTLGWSGAECACYHLRS